MPHSSGTAGTKYQRQIYSVEHQKTQQSLYTWLRAGRTHLQPGQQGWLSSAGLWSAGTVPAPLAGHSAQPAGRALLVHPGHTEDISPQATEVPHNSSHLWSVVPGERRRVKDLCHARDASEQRQFGLLRAPLTFLYLTVRSMPGPSRVVFFLVRLNSARREPAGTEISPILPGCAQQRGVLPWGEPPTHHTAVLVWLSGPSLLAHGS